MKRGKIFLLSAVMGIFLINFASAYYYGNLSLGYLLDQIDASTIFLGAVFIIAFAFVNQAMSRTIFKDNKQAGGIVSFAVAMLITYGMNRSGFDFDNIFYNIGYSLGLSEDFIYSMVILIIILGGAYLLFFWKHKKTAPYLLGALAIVASFFAYESAILIVFGIILIIVGWFINKKGPEERRRNFNNYGAGI